MRNTISFKVACPKCGDVLLTPLDLALEWNPNCSGAQYRFICPTCGLEHRAWANSPATEILMNYDVALEVIVDTAITEEDVQRCVEALRTEPDPLRYLLD